MKEYTYTSFICTKKIITFDKMCHETEGPTQALPELQ